MKKTIILAMPYLYGLDRLIEKNLQALGYTVINFCFDDRDSYYPNLISRIISFYNRKIRKSLNYKKRLKYRRYKAEFRQGFAALQDKKADYALCIRADAYPKQIIADIRRHSRWCVNYQWDGMHRFAEVVEYIPYFDRFFVFDKNDVQRYPQYRFHTISNFYFDFPETLPTAPGNDTLYFVGGMMESRTRAIQTFIEEAHRVGLPLDFHIACKDRKFTANFDYPGIRHLDREHELSFENNLQKAAACRAIVDFVISEHNGLSFRVFDALKYGKKLITTNDAVKKYDFYHENNMLIWHENDPFDKITEFLAKPFVPVPDAIKQKYSFSHWLETVLSEKNT